MKRSHAAAFESSSISPPLSEEEAESAPYQARVRMERRAIAFFHKPLAGGDDEPPPPLYAAKSKERLRLEWLCYRATQCVFLQSDDEVVVSAYGAGTIYARNPFGSVALRYETEPAWINGYRCQGQARPIEPITHLDARRWPNAYAHAEYEQLQRASVVRTTWIMAHFWGSPAYNEDASFDKAVGLVQRAAVTLTWNAHQFRATAMALATHMGVLPALLDADAAALGRCASAPAPPAAPLPLRPNSSRDDLIGKRYSIAQDQKPPARLQFERRVCAVFDWRVGMTSRRFFTAGEVVVSARPLPGREWPDLTADEIAASGGVMLLNIANALAKEARTEEALVQMLMAARGLDAAAHELADAVVELMRGGAREAVAQ